MHPFELLDLFPPHPRNDVVFVAMSFGQEFNPLWENVFVPAIGSVGIDGRPLAPHRVNLTLRSDSIVTEIVKCIGESRLILADISTVGWHGRGRKKRPIRNANVMYELGIAHAARLPEEVIVVRGDDDQLDFDIAGVRVHRYSRDPVTARSEVESLLAEALAAVDLRRSLAVERCVRSLDVLMFTLLVEGDDIKAPTFAGSLMSMVHDIPQLEALNRCTAQGLLEAQFREMTAELIEEDADDDHIAFFRRTPFGDAVFDRARQEMNFMPDSAEWRQSEAGSRIMKALEKLSSKEAPAGEVEDGEARETLDDEA